MRKLQSDVKTLSDDTLRRKINNWCRKLPSEYLQHLLTTPDLQGLFNNQRYKITLLGQLLKARFGSGEGNPAKQVLKAGYIDESTYHILMAWVDSHESLFRVFQIGWEEIHDEFKHLKNSPKSEIELFFECLREEIDGNILRATSGYNFSLKKGEVIGRLIRDVNLRGQQDVKWDFSLNSDELEPLQIIQCKVKWDLNSWKVHALYICQTQAKKDKVLHKALTRYVADNAYLFSQMSIACLAESKQNPPNYLQSYKWKNGSKKVRTKKGFVNVKNA